MDLGTDYWHSMDKQSAEKFNLNAKYIGISTPPFKDQLQSLKTRIFQGASQVELGFTGQGKGSASQGSITPEQIGKEEREQMRLLAKLNDVNLTTHATVGVGSLSGYDQRHQGFSKDSQEANMQEVRRTIDFAADVTKGGPVVVHTGEFPRPISKFKDEKFFGYKGEEEHSPVFIANKKTGQVHQLGRDLEIFEIGDKGPVKKSFQEIEKEFENLPQDDDQRLKAHNDSGVYFYRKHVGRQIGELEARKRQYESEASWYEEGRFQGSDQERNKAMAESYKENAMQAEIQIAQLKNDRDNLVPIDQEGIARSADSLSDAAIYAMQKESVIKERLAKEKDLYGKPEKSKPLFIAPENIFPENGYGSHPSELKELIQKSRSQMVDKLWKNNQPTNDAKRVGIYSKEDAEKAAQDHIKATFDIGHLNTWRKFFKGTEEEFNKWVGKQVDDLAKEKMIGHVHVTDNFGYFDEHVTPGEGSAPIAGFLKKIREAGYEDTIIIEPGHQDVKAWKGALSSFGSPVYRINNQTSSWTEIDGGYFSNTSSPNYLVGSYTPGANLGEEYNDWRFWSRLPIE